MNFSSPNPSSPSGNGSGAKTGSAAEITPKDAALVIGVFAAAFLFSWLFMQSSSPSGQNEQPIHHQHSSQPAERRIDMQGHRQNSSFSGASGSGFTSPEAAVADHQGGSARSQSDIEAEAGKFAARPSSEEVASSFAALFPREGEAGSGPIELFDLTEELEELPLDLDELDLDQYLDDRIPEEARKVGLNRKTLEENARDSPPRRFR